MTTPDSTNEGRVTSGSAVSLEMLIPHYFKLPSSYGDHAVCIGGRWNGWLMRRHPDGQWVSVEKLEVAS